MKRFFPTLRFRHMIRLSVLALATCMVLSSESARAQYPVYDTTAFIKPTLVNFQTPLIYDLIGVDSVGYHVAIGDVDGDGLNDVIAVCSHNDSVFVFRNNGVPGSLHASSFTGPLPFKVRGSNVDVKLVDIDGDGLLDIAVSNHGYGCVSILRNTSTVGSVSFAPYTYWGCSPAPSELNIGDFDGDGKNDIAVICGDAGSAPTYVPATPKCHLDILFNTATTGVINSSTVIKASIDSVTTGVNNFWISLSSGDIDGDGKADIVVSDHGARNIRIYSNATTSSASPLFTSHIAVSTLSTGASGYPFEVVVADINNDGHADIFVANGPQIATSSSGGTAEVSVFANTHLVSGAASALYFGSIQHFPTGISPVALVTGDFNGDGYGDIIVSNAGDNTLSVLKNTTSASGGTINFAAHSDIPVAGSTPLGLAVGDLDGVLNNNIPDFAVITQGNNKLILFRNAPVPDTVAIVATAVGLDSVCATSGSITLTGGRPASSVGHSTLTWTVTTGHAAVSASGVVTGVTAGADTIVALVTELSDTNKVWYAVRVLPGNVTTPITGATSVCVGDTIMLNNATPFGTWSISSGGSNATIDANGVVTGVAAGAVTVHYTITGPCVTGSAVQSYSITVNTLPVLSPISGLTFTSIGSGIPLSDTALGGNWVASNTHVTLSPLVGPNTTATGASSGTDTVYYYKTNGCGSDSVRTIINVCPPPVVGPIAGPDSVCAGGAHITLSDTPTVGTVSWSATPASIATIDAGGVITSGVAGTATVTYILTTTCGADTATKNIIVNPLPNAASISGSSTVCEGGTTALTETVPGTWVSTNPSVATVSSVGVVSGVSPTIAGGVDTIMYINSTFSCGSDTARHQITVNPLPVATAISGSDSVCSGGSTTLTATATNATGTAWSASGTFATVGSGTGIVTGTGSSTAGTTIITFTATNACGSDTTQHPMGVILSPFAGTISSTAATVCRTGTLAMNIAGNTAAGTWGSDNTAVATITTGGVVTGVTAGSANITYVVTTLSCGSDVATYPITVTDTPVVPAITGAHTICQGTTATLNDTYAGGGTTWGFIGTGGTHIHYVSGTGTGTPTISGFAVGVDTLKFSATNACGTTVVQFIDTVKPQPSFGAGIVGATNICAGTTTTLTDFGAVYTSTVWTIAGGSSVTEISHDSTHFVLQAGPPPGGTSLIQFTAINSCGSVTTNFTINVDTFLTLTPIVALHDTICLGQTDSAFASGGSNAGTTWDSYPLGVVSITSSDSSYAAYTATDTGIYHMVYSATNGCGTAYDTSAAFYVHPATPTAGVIFGYDTACVGTTSQLGDTTAGAAIVWSSSDPTKATVDATGLVTAIAPGTATITTLVHGYCADSTATVSFVVIAAPALTSPLTATTCDNAPFTYTAGSTIGSSTYTWVRPAVTGVGNAADSGITNTFTESLDDTTNAPVVVLYHFTISAAGCTTPATVTVTVEPTPLLTSPHADTVCSGTPFTYVQTTNVTGATVNYGWVRPAVTFVTPTTNHGTGNISETLTNGDPTLSPVTAKYYDTLKISGTTCFSVDSILVRISPAAPAPQITTFPPHDLCSRTYDMNFGASTVPPTGVTYSWSSTGGSVVFRTGSTEQYALVNFPTAGTNIVYLNSSLAGFDCPTKDSFIVNVSTSVSDSPEVVYFNNDFVCLRNDQDSYQWGYDDVSTVDSTILTGETNQHYSNSSPDLTHNFYWVITTHQGCMQKSYFNAPTGVQNINSGTVGELSVYPNPANQNINVEIKSSIFGGNYSVDIRNMLGQKVSEEKLLDHKASINVADLANGIYFVDCYRDGVKVATTRFVKN